MRLLLIIHSPAILLVALNLLQKEKQKKGKESVQEKAQRFLIRRNPATVP